MNEKTKHTPGPWVTHCGFVATADHKAICKMAYEGGVQFAAPTATLEDAANARLIAAAPDLLETLREVCAQHDAILAELGKPFGWGLIVTDRARAAIAKAEGVR